MTEREELQMLRALVEKQKEELAAKDQIIEKQNIQIENMIQALLHARKKLYGASTEVTKQADGQLSLFESVQELAKQLGVEQKRSLLNHTQEQQENREYVQKCWKDFQKRWKSISFRQMRPAAYAAAR